MARLKRVARSGLRWMGYQRTREFNRANFFCRGIGCEVGALTAPYRFTHATVTYADVCGAEEMRTRLKSIPIPNLYSGKLVDAKIILTRPRFEFDGVPSNHFDFVYSSHALEHTPNPFFAVGEQLRIVKAGGVVYAVIPNKEESYDRNRAATPIELLRHKFEKEVFSYTVEEALDVISNTTGHPLYEKLTESDAQRIIDEDLGIHHFHVFDSQNSLSMLSYLAERFSARVEYFAIDKVNIHFCLRKLSPSTVK